MLVKCLNLGRHLKDVSVFNGVNRLRLVMVMRCRGTIHKSRLTFIRAANHLGMVRVYGEEAREYMTEDECVDERQRDRSRCPEWVINCPFLFGRENSHSSCNVFA